MPELKMMLWYAALAAVVLVLAFIVKIVSGYNRFVKLEQGVELPQFVQTAQKSTPCRVI